MHLVANYLLHFSNLVFINEKNIFHPRLYYSIDRMSGNSYKVQYYANIFDDRGDRLLIADKQDFVEPKNTLYKLNINEFKNLNQFIKRQEKIIKIYKEKNEKEKMKIINSSLDTLIDLKVLFNEWFKNNNEN